MSNLTLTSTTSSEAELRHAVSSDWKTPPSSPTDAPDSAEKHVPLDQTDPKDYNRIRDRQVAEKKFEGPDFLKDEPRNDRQKNGWKKRIDKLTAKVYAAERRNAELEAKLAGNGSVTTQAAPVASSQAQPSRTPQPAAPNPSKIAATGDASGSPLNRREYNPAFEEAARAIPGIEKVLAAADAISVSPALYDNLVKTTTAADRPRLMKFLTESPRVLQELDRDPGSASQRIAQIVRDLKGASQNRPAPNSSAQNSTDVMRRASLLDAHNRRVQTALNSLPDANQLMAAAGRLPVAMQVAEAMIEQDNSDAVVIHLARNPGLLAELNAMSATAAAAKVGRLAAEIEARAREAAKPKERIKPPDPISPVGGGSNGTGKSLEDMPIRDFIKVRNKQERAWKSRR